MCGGVASSGRVYGNFWPGTLGHKTNTSSFSDRPVIHSPAWLEGVTRCRVVFGMSLD